MANNDINNGNQPDKKNSKMISDSSMTNNDTNIRPKAKQTQKRKITQNIITKTWKRIMRQIANDILSDYEFLSDFGQNTTRFGKEIF